MPDLVITIDKPIEKEVNLKKASPKAISVEQSSGGGTAIKLMPTAELAENAIIFHYVTLDQMAKMEIEAAEGRVRFALTEDEENFYLRFSDDSPSAIAGEIAYEDSIEMRDYVFETIRISATGFTPMSVFMDGVDANLLEADINWRLADIQRKVTDVAQETTSQQILTAVENIDIDTSDLAKQGTLTAAALQIQQGFDKTLELLREAGEESQSYVHNFSVGLYDEYYTISGKLSTSYSKEVKGAVITQSLKMESNSRISFTSEATGTLVIYASNSKTTPFNVSVDGENVEFDTDGKAETVLTAGEHTITKGTANTFIFYVELIINSGSYISKIDMSAKQGSNEGATNTAIYEALNTLLNFFSDITVGDVMSELEEAGITAEDVTNELNN